jgi:MAS20 protein import receptor
MREEDVAREASKKGLRNAWLELKAEEYPKRVEEKEQFFLQQITAGEGLFQQGTNNSSEIDFRAFVSHR